MRSTIQGISLTRRLLCALCIAAALIGNAVTPLARGTQTEEIVVVGKRPGPPLWKVEAGDNTLWIFGVIERLPKSFVWDSESVDYMISQSAEYLAPPSGGLTAVTLNPIKIFRYTRQYKKARRLPDKGTLDQLLPSPLFGRLNSSLDEFLPGEKNVLKLKPVFAADALYKAALKDHGLVGPREITKALSKMAKTHGVPVIEVGVKETAEVAQVLEDWSSIPIEQGVACLASTLDTLEEQVARVSERAQVWADGDAASLASAKFPAPPTSCRDALMGNEQTRRVYDAAREAWLSAAERALASNTTTFAVLALSDVIEADGLLSLLRKRGYKTTGPMRL